MIPQSINNIVNNNFFKITILTLYLYIINFTLFNSFLISTLYVLILDSFTISKNKIKHTTSYSL